jgi:hypothetical protein
MSINKEQIFHTQHKSLTQLLEVVESISFGFAFAGHIEFHQGRRGRLVWIDQL